MTLTHLNKTRYKASSNRLGRGFAIVMAFLSSASLHAQGPEINELSVGLNGDSSVQFVEITRPEETFGGIGPGINSVVGRAQIGFYDARGVRVARYVFMAEPQGNGPTFLAATPQFEAAYETITIDYAIPAVVYPTAGKVCLEANPDNDEASFDAHCLAYGGDAFTVQGDQPTATASGEAYTTGRESVMVMRDSQNVITGAQIGLPTPNSSHSTQNSMQILANTATEAPVPAEKTLAEQGETLFFNETFSGNGRTCSTCHFESDSFGLNPETVASLEDSHPLFVHEQNINTIVVDSTSSVNPTGVGAQPSDFNRDGLLTGSLGGSAKIVGGTGGMYQVIGGQDLNTPGNVLSDGFGNVGRLVSFNEGDLQTGGPANDQFGLESSEHLRGGRALIVANVNGFDETANLRAVPSLVGSRLGRGTGHSLIGPFAIGSNPTRDEFNALAVKQHLTRSLNRETHRDFRPLSSSESEAITEFIGSLLPQDWRDGHDQSTFPSVFSFAFTQEQLDGANLFGMCDRCHSGSGGQSTIAVNTGVSDRPINEIDGIPTEQAPGEPVNSRVFEARNLINLDKSAPYFHDNSAATLEDSITHYVSDEFLRNTQQNFRLREPEVVSRIAKLLRMIRPLPFRTSVKELHFPRVPIDRGPSDPKTMTLTNTSDAPLHITNVHLKDNLSRLANPPYDESVDFKFHHEAIPEEGLAPGETIDFHIVFDPDNSISFVTSVVASLEFTLTSGNESFEAGVRFRASRDERVDFDQDGIDPPDDNCELIPNPSQSDIDNDGEGDVCDFDIDGDGLNNHNDNCPSNSNLNQRDFDQDSIGDACDLDADNDQLSNTWEREHGLNPFDQSDAVSDRDSDGFTARQEFEFRTDPNEADTDKDRNGRPDRADFRQMITSVLTAIYTILE